VIQRAGGTIAEFPLATTSILLDIRFRGRGGYLRQFPLAIIRRAFREANDRDEPATFYIHPWEIDPGQPRLAVSALNRIRHYRGLGGTLGRIDKLLEEFSFDAIASYLPALEETGTARQTAGAA
jgi:hypothetical protein